MNYKQTRLVLESRMTDRCNIYRHRLITNIDGTTDLVLDNEPLHANVKCRISFIRYKIENPSDIKVDENPIRFTPKIFFPVFTDVKAGDKLVVTRYSSENEELGKYEGVTGMPAYYDTHTEIMLNVNTDA